MASTDPTGQQPVAVGLQPERALPHVEALPTEGRAGGARPSPATVAVFQRASELALDGPVPLLSAANVAVADLSAEDPEVQTLLAALGVDAAATLAELAPAVGLEGAGAVAVSSTREVLEQLFGVDGGPARRRRARWTRTRALRFFARDLVAEAAEGNAHRVIGRAGDLQQLMRVLSRHSKNNPVLVGDPGVGKTAVVEALAQQLAAGDVPDVLAGRPLLGLDIGELTAGARLRGDFEERLGACVAEAVQLRAMLFIDELHQIVGGGVGRSEAADVATLLKPALARGELAVIGATTHEEFRRFIMADAALERHFQPVVVLEPAPEQTQTILAAVTESLGRHRKVGYTGAALQAAADLTVCYLPQQRLPNKAVDVLDEAGAHAALTRSTLGPAARRWYDKPYELTGARDIAVLTCAAAAAGRGDEVEAGRNLERVASALHRHQSRRPTSAGQLDLVDVADVEQIVADRTGVPLGRLTADGGSQLRGVGERLRARVVGQDAAVDAVFRAVRRHRAGRPGRESERDPDTEPERDPDAQPDPERDPGTQRDADAQPDPAVGRSRLAAAARHARGHLDG